MWGEKERSGEEDASKFGTGFRRRYRQRRGGEGSNERTNERANRALGMGRNTVGWVKAEKGAQYRHSSIGVART